MNNKKQCLLLLSLCLGSGTVYAAPTYTMPEIVVTATKTAEPQTLIPQSTEIITADSARASGAYDLRSALLRADALSLPRDGRGGSAVSLRGMNSNHVLILVDGERLVGEDSGSTANRNLLDRINFSSVDRIEIVRNPSSALYGSDAMAGVINIITKTPEKADHVVSLDTGSEEVSQALHYASGKLGRWSFSTDLRHAEERRLPTWQDDFTPSSTNDGWESGYMTNLYGRRTYVGAAGVYDFQNQNQNKIHLHASYTDEDLQKDFPDDYREFNEAYEPETEPFKGYFEKDKHQWFQNKTWNTGISYTGDTGRNKYLFRVGYSQLKKDSWLRNDRNNSLPTISRGPHMSPIKYNDMNPVFDFDKITYKEWTAEARDSMTLNDSHTLTFGANYQSASQKGTRISSMDSDTAGNEGSVTMEGKTKGISREALWNSALYVQDEWGIGDQFFLIPALRLDHNSRFGSELSPSLGATWLMDDHTRLKFNYGRSYRAPSLSEMYFRFNHFGMFTIYGNPDLQPEKGIGWDVALEAERGRTSASISYFDNKIKNLIDDQAIAPDDHTNHDRHYVNIGRAHIYGAELSMSHKLSDRWTAKATWMPLRAVDEDTGEALENRARHTVTAQLLYDDHQDTGYSGILWFQLNNRYRYAGAADDGTGKTTGTPRDYTFHTVNFALTRTWHKDIALHAGVSNIFNERTDKNHGDDLYIDGRMWNLGMDFHF